MRKILIPIAHFESSLPSLDLGARLSKALSADFTILHVAADSGRSHLGSGVATGKLAEWGIEPPQFKVLQQARLWLQERAFFQLDEQGTPLERHSLKMLAQGLFEMHLIGDKGQNVRFRLREGNPVREVLREAEDPLYDLIVAGTRGRRGLKRLLVGSIAQELALHTPCSILVAKNLMPDQAILVGVTGLETSQEAVRQAGLLAAALNVPINLLAVTADEAGVEAAEQNLSQAGQILSSSVRVVSMLRVGEPSATLIAEAGEKYILALGRARRSKVKEIFLGDVSLKILDQSHGPVLISSFPRSVSEPGGVAPEPAEQHG